MSSLVIVALPTQDDYVNKISSEKVPHMTLLFLGEDSREVKNLGDIISFTGHAAKTSLSQFGMEVDRRGTLGPDKADVLFFSKEKWSGYEALRDFRSFLLQDNNIRTAYDSVPNQFEEWLPHLTLGYPDTPANPDERDYPGITYVNFDRIAVWYEEYDGIEFPLSRQNWDLAMSDVVEDILKHVGVKGMKWGVHKNHASSTTMTPRKEKKLNKLLSSREVMSNTHNAVLPVMVHYHLPRINAKYSKEINNGTLKNPNHPKTKAYHRDLSNAYVKEINKLNSNAVDYTGTRRIRAVKTSDIVTSDPKNWSFKLVAEEIKHVNTISYIIKVTNNDDGTAKSFDLSEDVVKQSSISNSTSDLVQDILEHHGVKGMKWGVRSKTPHSVAVSDKGKKLKTSGGAKHPAHPDAVRARTIGQVGKKSGLKALSNEELQTYAHRLQLEQNVKRLNFNDMNPGKKFVATIMGRTGSSLASEGVNRGTREVGKRAVKLAMA